MNGVKVYLSNVKKNFKIKNCTTCFIFLFVIVLFIVLQTTGLMKSRSTLQILEKIGYYIIAAMSLSLVVGFLGELSIGHAAFMSIGAFSAVAFRQTVLLSLTKVNPLLSLIIAVFVGGLAAAVFGFIIGLPALRLKGDYLAIVTLAFGEIVKIVLKNIFSAGESVGELRNLYRYNYKNLYIICFIFAILTFIVISNLIKSKHGRAIMSIRDNEIAARAMGVNVTGYKLSVFIISAFFAGVAGVFFGVSQDYSINPASFDYNRSINLLVMVVLGGMGNINGSIIAAVVITFIDSKLSTMLGGNLAVLKDLFYALILIVLVIYNNAPKLKGFREKHGFGVYWSKFTARIVKLFSKKELKQDPAKEKEFGADWSRVPTKVEMDAILSTDLTPDKSYVPDKPVPDGKTKGSGKGDK